METTTGKAAQPYVLGENEGEAIWYVNNRATIKATAAQTGGAFGLVEMLVAPNHPIPLHIHHAEDEALWVLEGQLTVRAGDSTYTAGPGSLIFGPKGVPHTFRVDGGTPARLLVLMVPGGGEGFFVEAGRPAAGPGMPPPAPPDVAALAAVAARYHQEFIGPPLAPARARTRRLYGQATVTPRAPAGERAPRGGVTGRPAACAASATGAAG